MLCLPDIMKVLAYLIYIAVASFAVLAKPAVAQGVPNATLTLTYCDQVLQGNGTQICTKETRENRKWYIKTSSSILLRFNSQMSNTTLCSYKNTNWQSIRSINCNISSELTTYV